MAFKMKGSPMHRNFGVGSPMNKNGDPKKKSKHPNAPIVTESKPDYDMFHDTPEGREGAKDWRDDVGGVETKRKADSDSIIDDLTRNFEKKYPHKTASAKASKVKPPAPKSDKWWWE